MKLPLLAAFAALIGFPALAQNGIEILDPYARIVGPAGAAYFRLFNDEAKDEALLSATSPDAGMVMLMQSMADPKGVMKMNQMADGFAIAAGQAFVLGNAGAHVMLMNLTRKIKTGDRVTLILTFKNAGAVSVTLPVDNARTTDPGPTPNDAMSNAAMSNAAMSN